MQLIGRLPEKTSDAPPLSRQGAVGVTLFIVILGLGIFARVWEFGRLPPGLNADEASNGVDALDIYRYGSDRSGLAYPVKFVSWGGGQDALYGYVLVPFVATLGLTPSVIRLPMLLTGILALPLFYVVARDVFGRRIGLLAMFFLAISPWHILLSRWGLEANLFPFVFLAAFACLLRVRHNQWWFMLACLFLGAALYSYGTAYAVVPVFAVIAGVILRRQELVQRRTLVAGAAIFGVLAVPIALMLAVNTLRLPSIMLGPLTIPRFPVEARFASATILGGGDVLRAVVENLWGAVRLLAVQSDGILYNVVEPFGYFYKISFPIALVGVILLAGGLAREARVETLLLAAWMGAACLVPVFQAVNINRFNIIFLPLLLCTAYAIGWFERRWNPVMAVTVILLLGAFAGFTAAYHGAAYRTQANWKFHAGLLPALEFARQAAANPICMTDQINMPYIFALFSGQASPEEFLRTARYVDPTAPLRQVASFGDFTFGSRSCSGDRIFTYVLTTDEIPPRLGNRYQYKFFNNFVVYYPKP